MPFSDLRQTNAIVSEFQDLSAERFPVGFMDLLGVHCYALTHEPPMSFPAIPNSSSTEALTGEEKKRDNQEEEEEDDDDGEEQKLKRNKRFKITKNSEERKMRVPKVSFITKSEVLHLEDGYKWRKYGQKPVKNSPFPRNYYRCTTSWCDVKKRVERSFTDPSTVITTYEGQHTHPSPLLIMPKRSSFRSINDLASVSHFGLPTLPPQLFHYNNQHHQQQLSFSGTRYLNNQENGFDDDRHHVVKKLVIDHGLLEDVVSSYIIKEEHLVNRIMK